MHIIGTAGHVDHGKTCLIKALTGIDTDRLPEEKKRGLTIDLGFAHFKNTEGEDIGVVDVPGHEKFIRNMTAGAWGIDLALLVVAADDGWMYQTENHLHVLTAMGINQLIAVITKTDIVPAERVKEVADDVELRILDKTGQVPPLIAVSSVTDSGISELKNLIIRQLSLISDGLQNRTASDPLIYIDRVFTIRGAGLVVTGSLREGAVRRGDSLVILPEGREVRVRGLQTYDTETDRAVPACRTALNISGTDASEVRRGCCLTTAGSGFTAEKELILKLTGDCSNIRNHSEAEFAAGTDHTIGTIHLIKDESGIPVCARVVLDNAMALRYSQPVVIIRKGGSLITGSGNIIWKGKTNRDERISIIKASAGKPGVTRAELQLAVKGFATDNGKWVFDQIKKAETEKILLEYASGAGGLRREELSGKLDMPAGAADFIISSLLADDKLVEKNGTLFSGDSSDTRAKLSENARKILDQAGKEGKLGLDLNKTRIPGAKIELRNLTRAGLIIPLAENLFLTQENYENLKADILRGLNSGDTFDIAHAKERSGLSRKYIIPLLNRMEEDGFVEREENLRRVRKAAG